MISSLEQKIAAAFFAALLLLLVFAGISYQNAVQSIDASHSHQLLDQIATTFAHVQDAETGQRGYLITGEDSYLAPYTVAVAQLPTDLARLHTLTADDPAQQRQAGTLEQAVNGKLRILERTVAVQREQGREAARQIVLTDEGKQAMDAIRKAVADMEETESRRLGQQAAQLETSAREAILAFAVLAVLALLLLATVFRVIRADLARRQQMETERTRLLAAEQTARAAAEAAQHRFAFLAEASGVLASSLDYETTLTTVARLAVPAVADWCSVHVVAEDGTVRQLAVVHTDPAKVAWAEELGRRFPSNPQAPTGLYRVLRTGQPEIYPEITEALLAATAQDPEQLAIIQAVGFTSVMLLPLQARGRTLGVLTLVSAESGRHYNPSDVTLAQDLAQRAAQAVDNARLFQEVQLQRERFAITLASIGDAVVATDPTGHITFLNPVAAALTGWAPTEALGQPLDAIFTIVAEGTRAPVETPVARVLREGTVVGIANGTVLVARDGTECSIDDSAAPIRDEQDQVVGVVLVFRDITERQRSAAARQAQRVAEEANRAKSEFLSRMSHELRTPLNSILGFAQLLDLEGGTPEQRESIHYILRGGRHLLELINEVLDIARIEEGRLPLSPEPVPVQELLLQSLNLVRPLATARALHLPTTLPEPCATHVLADRQRLQQVLLNLLTNAIKYNRPGGTVQVRCATVAADRLRIFVEDTGLGLTPDQVDRLFTPFERLGAEQSQIEGTGLGLALSQRLVQAMGGTIGVASTPGEGSSFWLELAVSEDPVERLARTGEFALALAQPGGRAARVLYVEDNLSNLKLIERLLAHRANVRLLSAMQGQLGLELAREHQPDLILLDLHLPDLAGDEVLRRLQGDATTRRIPVVIMSADATPNQIVRLRAAGARDYLTKPIDVARFLTVVDDLLQEGIP
jgi:PAS domain S-box-containing protein